MYKLPAESGLGFVVKLCIALDDRKHRHTFPSMSLSLSLCSSWNNLDECWLVYFTILDIFFLVCFSVWNCSSCPKSCDKQWFFCFGEQLCQRLRKSRLKRYVSVLISTRRLSYHHFFTVIFSYHRFCHSKFIGMYMSHTFFVGTWTPSTVSASLCWRWRWMKFSLLSCLYSDFVYLHVFFIYYGVYVLNHLVLI